MQQIHLDIRIVSVILQTIKIMQTINIILNPFSQMIIIKILPKDLHTFLIVQVRTIANY